MKLNVFAAAAASIQTSHLISLAPADILIIVIYFAVVLGIGVYLKRYANTANDFFMAGREMSAWVAGLSFLSANLGALELMGWAAATYQYGILAAHFYWIAAFPALPLMGLVMMPFYYVSKTHSVPGYLHLRFGEATRALGGISFAVMTILMSGINMYAMAIVMKVVLGWNIHFSIWVSSLTVAAYVTLGGLYSAIFNEVLQFFLIWVGVLTVPVLGLIEAGGWSGLVLKIHQRLQSDEYVHLWSTLGTFSGNPMGVNWAGMLLGLGGVIAFGYWGTDFLVIQRAMAAKDLRSARLAPIIAAYFKMMVPVIVILPGLLALAVLPYKLVPEGDAGHGLHSYNEVLPLMLARYCGPGLLGLGITALIAGFMSGMAGNVSAFSTVWTYDLYKPLINKKGSDSHYVLVGRLSIVIGVAVSIGAAYLVMHAAGIMDYVQALFSFFIAPLLGAILMGMFWKRATAPAGFLGLLIGILTSVSLFVWVKFNPVAMHTVALSPDATAMAANLYRALWAFLTSVIVIFVVSLFTKPKPVAELDGLVYGATILPKEDPVPFYKNVWLWAILAVCIFATLNILFW